MRPTRPIRTARLDRRTVALAALAFLPLLAGCGERAPDADDEAGAPVPVDAEPRIAPAPTAEGELPPAILGRGGPPQGTPMPYLAGDDATVGYLAVPGGEGPFPALVIVHEWNGLTDRVRQVADDLAAEGYVTLAVDLYRGRTGSNPDENMALVREVQGDQAAMIANLDAAVASLKSRTDVSGRVGAMGWCFGGGVALSYGLDGADHEATAIFYGQLVDDPERLAGLSHEVYGTFAALDEGIPPAAVESFASALREAGIENDVHVYDDVGHGFWLRVDEDPETRTEPALDAWRRLKAYLERTLGG